MEITQIKEILNIITVLAHYGLKSDKNSRLLCPFHEDTNPSMQVYPKTNTVYCFSSNCKLGVPTFDRTKKLRHISPINLNFNHEKTGKEVLQQRV